MASLLVENLWVIPFSCLTSNFTETVSIKNGIAEFSISQRDGLLLISFSNVLRLKLKLFDPCNQTIQIHEDR